MIPPIVSFIGNSFNGNSFAFIYIIYTKEFNLIYIGQTNERCGTIGRLSSHLSQSGTFRNHFERITGYPLEVVKDLKILSFNLGGTKQFTSTDTTYREGVEYLVQKFLHEFSAKLPTYYRVISFTRPNSTTSLKYIKKLAREIASNFENIYTS